jgi:hypothetical protein
VTDRIAEHRDRLLSIPGVVGVAEGARAGEPCIKVLVEKRTAETLAAIPKALDGVAVEVEESGEIRARPDRDAF